MCGIVGIVDKSNLASPIIYDALKRLEYRGYDSAGIATIYQNTLFIKKEKGKINEIHEKLDLNKLLGTVGIGHTRWATHGLPSKNNAHPHVDCTNKIAVVHNGIIENFLELREELEKRHTFTSETDTEVIPHLIEETMVKTKCDLHTATRNAIKKLRGTYALAVICAKEPNKLVCARNESPLVIGIGVNANYCASDIPALLPMTRRIVLLSDGEMASIYYNKLKIETINGEVELQPNIVNVSWTPEMAQKGGYPHFMLKEIHEQSHALNGTLMIRPELINQIAEALNDSKRLYITAAGTSYHAGLAGRYMLSKLSAMQSQAIISSEFIESTVNLVDKDTTILAISQSGETADTLNAIKYAKDNGAKIVSITNVMGSTISRLSDLTLYTQAGPEIGVAATKTFLVQLASLALISLQLGDIRGKIDGSEMEQLREELFQIPRIVDKTIKKQESLIRDIAYEYAHKTDFLFLGRGISTTTAMEGSLKLKEIAYIHSEAYPAGESKHGPIALIEPGFPVVFISPPDETRDKIIGNIMEMKARQATIISLAYEKDQEIQKLSNRMIGMAAIPAPFSPITYVTPLQLLAYYAATKRGYDPDKPRNLAKSVTVL
ncbi:MAG: glutamine--fructose-6-phosphate transaminase (isomerizing) [Candidatus Jordarchaeum sp.]|uniref:glutamine--fructose-6-phosphate transaminase (isomerizing) n=1 Tax=Candidatus Jordarchaeum sp. TaxID=2823881 RepID=UPI00404B9A80